MIRAFAVGVDAEGRAEVVTAGDVERTQSAAPGSPGWERPEGDPVGFAAVEFWGVPRSQTTKAVTGRGCVVDDGPLAALTECEREVLALMAEGRTNGSIARALVVSEAAVRK